jgi:recombination protein RecA
MGNRTRVRVVKNKVAPPFKVAEFDIMYNEGISKVGDLLDIGVDMELIEKRGSFYSYDERRIAQGRENAKQYLKDNPEISDQIEMLIRSNEGLVDIETDEALHDEEALPQEGSEEGELVSE